MTRSNKLLFGVLLVGSLVFPVFSFAAQTEGFVLRWIPVGLQVSSTVSDGVFTMEEVVDAAHEAGLSALIVTDRDSMRWEYGLWPFRRLLKKRVERPSISTYGYANYLRDIEFQSKRYPDLIVIPGTEAAPFYYWTGLPFTRSLKINDWHRHILVAGLTLPEDLRGLPNVARPSSLRRPLRWLDLLRLFPFALIGLGVSLFFRRECHYTDEKGIVCSRFAMRWRVAGIVFGFCGLLFVINESPFHPSSYDQYSGDAGYRPYQILIDYVRAHGGLTFWAHPDADNIDERDSIKIETAAHPKAVLETVGYTGFCIFSEGYKVVGEPGGQWDRVLLEYCRGERSTPVWAVTGMSFDEGGREELIACMRGSRTYVLANALNWHDISEAMRYGRMYATVGGREKPLLLYSFSVLDSSSGVGAISGQEIIMSGSPVITLSAFEEGGETEEAAPAVEKAQGVTPEAITKVKEMIAKKQNAMHVKLIRGGAVIKEEAIETPLQFLFIDNDPPKQRTYYRVIITKGPQIIATNPIFVRPKPKDEEAGK